MLSNCSQGGFTRLLLSVFGTDVIGGNFNLIPLVLVCSAELISKQICKKLNKFSYIKSVAKIRNQFFKILNLTLFSSTKNVTVCLAKNLRMNDQRI